MARAKARTSVEAVERLAHTALASGGIQRGFRRVEWDIAGRCVSPVFVVQNSGATERVAILRRNSGWRDKPMMEVTLETRCRKCEPCLRQRAHLWRMRAIAEFHASARTWFGTLTLRPSEHLRTEASLRVALHMQGLDFDTLPDAEKYSERLKFWSPEITLFLKRIRKNSGAEVRYLFVAEKHKSGLPHWHILLHEVSAAPVRKAVLDKAWRAGFSKFELCRDAKTAVYLCKYLSKSLECRVRASQEYGTPANIQQYNVDHNHLSDSITNMMM